MAPDIDIENRPLQEFLEWVARETGRKLVMADDATRRQVGTIRMHGNVRGLTPMEALMAVMASTSLRFDLPAGVIRVSFAGESHDRVTSLCLLFARVSSRAARRCEPRANYRARTTVEALLRALQPLGIDVIYSSDLVPPDLPAPPPRAGDTPLQRATDALAAHGLALRADRRRRNTSWCACHRAEARAGLRSAAGGNLGLRQPLFDRRPRRRRAARVVRAATSSVVPGSHDDALRALQVAAGPREQRLRRGRTSAVR